MTRVLVVGSGAREHALTWKLGQSPRVDEILIAPGNPGTATAGRNVPVEATDVEGILALVVEERIDLTVIGPEQPLELGLSDALRAAGHRVVGPSTDAFKIEGSKSFAKQLMQSTGIPTAEYAVFDDRTAALAHVGSAKIPLVIKADGLAAGKGVVICETRDAAAETVRNMMSGASFGEAGSRIVVEEYLDGPEISLIGFVDGETICAFPVAQDHKRIGDGGIGPNTGGMGAYAPVPFVSDLKRDELVRLCLRPVVEFLAAKGTPYRGILFAGLILTQDGPKVLEYNCRFGDPEAESLLALMDGDALPWFEAMADGTLAGEIPVRSGVALGVVIASAGYPGAVTTGSRIDGLAAAAGAEDTLVFQAGTTRGEDGAIVTAGGRVLTVVGLGNTVDEAAARAYGTPVRFDGMYFRKDIGWQARNRMPAIASAIESKRPRLVVLASGDGSNLQALIDACSSGSLDARIVGVVSHTPGAGAIVRAQRAGIPSFVLPITDKKDQAQRRELECGVADILNALEPHLVVLGGWMLILSPEFVESCRCPIINVHPALLSVDGEPLDIPVLKGAHAVRDALEMKLPYTGVSVHYVTADVDSGPVIVREAVIIIPEETEEELHGRLKAVEHRLLVGAVRTTLKSHYVGGIHA